MLVRGIRGATTVTENNADEIVLKTREMIEQMIHKNGLLPEQVAQVIITVTHDIDAAFPARALRMIDGWSYVPVMCALEIPVPNSLPKCIRVMMTVNTNVTQEKIEHIYLHGAQVLRPDLQKNS
ncbi:MAG TPA: chorismate mutase [Massilibacterium sp.]|nr:chorismate mutase [Massilibacterium sp.]